jgi:hypothetical protein
MGNGKFCRKILDPFLLYFETEDKIGYDVNGMNGIINNEV